MKKKKKKKKKGRRLFDKKNGESQIRGNLPIPVFICHVFKGVIFPGSSIVDNDSTIYTALFVHGGYLPGFRFDRNCFDAIWCLVFCHGLFSLGICEGGVGASFCELDGDSFTNSS